MDEKSVTLTKKNELNNFKFLNLPVVTYIPGLIASALTIYDQWNPNKFRPYISVAIIAIIIFLGYKYHRVSKKYNCNVRLYNNLIENYSKKNKLYETQVRENRKLKEETEIIMPFFLKLNSFFIDFKEMDENERTTHIKVINEYQKEYPNKMQTLIRRW